MKQHAVRLIVVLAMLCVGIMAFAQSDTARLIGTVTDPTGAAIQGATITVTNLGTNRTLSVTSNGSGDYVVPQLPSGNYRAEAKQTNFKKAVAEFTLEVSQIQAINFKLQIGGMSDVVNVTDEVPLVETATSSTGEVIQGRQVTELPLNGRNFTQLALLAPGVTRGAYGDSAMGGTNGTSSETFRNSDTGGSALSVNGLRPQANNFILDGLDNNEALVNSIVFFPPAEAIQEFRVNTSVAPAEFGRAGGAIVQTQIKSGTNQYHGSAFWFRQSGEMNARAYNNPLTEFKRNQFGGTLGGPIIKDKLFAFVDYQGLRQNQPVGAEYTFVPTLKQRDGDFSEYLASSGLGGEHMTTVPVQQICPGLYSGGSVLSQFAGKGYVFNPQTCLPFGWNGTVGTNIIDSSYRNSTGMALINAYPVPNLTPAGVNNNNFQANRKSIRTFDDFDARIDWVATPKDTVFVRGSSGQDIFTVTDRLVDANHDLPSGWGSGYNYNHPKGLAAGYTHTFSSSVVNEFRFGYLRPMFGYAPPGTKTMAEDLGIPNANRNGLLTGMALIGGWSWGPAPGINNPQLEYTGDGGLYSVPQKAFQFQDSISYVAGRHTFKFGANFIKRQVDFAQGNNAKGYFWIDDYNCGPGCGGLPWGYSGLGAFTGSQVSELEAGFMSGYVIGNLDSYYKTHSWETGYFAQDDFRVSRKLTLNLGLRYDYYTWPTEESNRQSNFDPATGTLIEATTAVKNKSLINPDKNNIGPRIGFAYDVLGTGKTVVRGGYGMFFYLDRGGIGNQLSNNPDFNGTSSYYACPTPTTCDSGYRITLSGAAPNGSNNPTVATGALPSATNFANPLALTANNNVVYYPKNNRNSEVQQWNLSVEQQITSNTALAVAYVGTKMDHLATQFNANGGSTKWFPNVGTIQEYANIGSGTYNGLQTRLNRRMTKGLQYTLSYTWSHTLDNSNGAFTNSGNSRIIVDNNGNALLNYNKGNSDSDIRHYFTGSVLYELPWGKGRMFMSNAPKALDYVIGGWQMNNILTLASGSPMDVYYGNGLRPNYNGGCTLDASQYVWISCPTGAFTPAASGKVGNLARNFFHGPGTHVWDASMIKDFPLAESVKMQFRAEFFNITNTPQWQNPTGQIDNGNFGKVGTPGTVTTRFSSERHVQFALRLTF